MTLEEVPNGHHAAGEFTTTTRSAETTDTVENIALARTIIDKVFQGQLDATGVVEMLSAGGGAPGSAGYVAIERVTGTLDGHAGTFVLQHTGTMTRGEAQLAISVVPDSGTGELKTISGTMKIVMGEGKKSYEFDYWL